MAFERGATAACQQSETIIESFGDLLQAQYAYFRGGEFYRQRDAVQAVADLGEGGRVVIRHGECRNSRSGAVNEKFDGFILTQRFNRGEMSQVWQSKRWNLVRDFARDAQRFATACKNARVR